MRIWIVEMRNDGTGRYEPTTSGAALTRAEANDNIKDWRSACPDDKFRVTKYVSMEPQR